jgi:hypothetical protein
MGSGVAEKCSLAKVVASVISQEPVEKGATPSKVGISRTLPIQGESESDIIHE